MDNIYNSSSENKFNSAVNKHKKWRIQRHRRL